AFERFIEALFQTSQATGEAFENLGFAVAEGDGIEQLVEGYRALFLQRARVGHVVLTDAHRIHDDEPGFALYPGIDLLPFGLWNDPHAPALHLLEEAARFDRAHEENNFQRLDVGAGGDHVNRDGNARVIAVSKGLKDLVWRKVRDFFPDDFLDLL